MMRRATIQMLFVCLLCWAGRAAAQVPAAAAPPPAAAPPTASLPPHLTLDEARRIALTNHPRIRQAENLAAARNEVTTQARAAYFPNVYGSLTGVEAQPDSRIAAGFLNNPSIFNRFAGGVTVQQLVTDFGRTQNLVASARLESQAAQAEVTFSRADVLLGVDRAFYDALRAQAILRVAEQTVNQREIVAEQITALAKSNLKSGLDVSFARVNLEEARLLLVKSQNDVEATSAALSEALGYAELKLFVLEDPGETPQLPAVDQALAAADRDRPELASARLLLSSAQRFATAERDLWFPSIALAGVAGGSPYHQPQIPDFYAAAGFNVNIPIFNGRAFNARKREADDRARATAEALRALQMRVARDVRFAWLNANTAFQNLALTAQLLDEANKALELAQARYNLGLGSIVELSQAQLNQAQAGIQQASAKYDYQTRIAELNYQEGALR